MDRSAIPHTLWSDGSGNRQTEGLESHFTKECDIFFIMMIEVDSFHCRINMFCLLFFLPFFLPLCLLYQMSFHQFCRRILKKYTGMTYIQLIQTQKLQTAANLLKQTMLPVTEVAQRAGYENVTFFYKKFQEKYHCQLGGVSGGGNHLRDHLGTEFTGFFLRKKPVNSVPKWPPFSLFYTGLKHADSYSTYILLL